MNVLIVSPFFPFPEDSGSKIRLVSLIRSLQRHHVTLIVFKERQEAIHEQELKAVCDEYFIFDRPKIPVFREWLNHFSFTPMLASRFFDRAAWKKTREIIRGRKMDVLIIETLLMVKYAERAAGTLLILDEHNLEFARAESRLATATGMLARIYQRLIMLRLQRFELRAIREFDYCLACSEHDGDVLASRVKGASVVVVPNAVDTDHFSQRPPFAGQKKIVFLGTLWYEPNRDAVLYFAQEILPRLRLRVPGVEFIVIGPGPSRDVAALAQQGDVTVTGYVDDVRPYLAEASVTVAPLRIGSGTRLKILTAMAMGVPVVSTSVGMQGIQGTDREDFCIADDPGAFLDCIQRLIIDVQFNRQIGENGRKLVVGRYSRNIILQKLRELWEQIEKVRCA